MSDDGEGRGCLFAVSMGIAVVAGLAAFATAASTYVIVGFALGCGLLYPITAVIGAEICSGLRAFAFPGSRAWSGGTKAHVGAVWPLAVLFWLVITPFFALINRLFR